MRQYGATQRFFAEDDPRLADIYNTFFAVLEREQAKHTAPAARMDVTVSLALMFRAMALSHQLIEYGGRRVLAGPFKGMNLFPGNAIQPVATPIISGAYEYELHPLIEHVCATPYDTVINIGCAEGYYAVGLARRLPHTRIIAAEVNPAAQATACLLADLNGVTDRITFCGEITAAELGKLVSGRTLVLCDIEGGEDELLNPAAAPALRRCDMLIEQHEVFRPGISDRLAARFSATHAIERIEPGAGNPPEWPLEFRHLTDLERMLLQFEGRQGYTPWGFYGVKS